MPIQIHNKTYVTVAERVQEAGSDLVSVDTQVLQFSPIVVIKATVTINNKGVFTGISAANSDKTIEKQSPYEVAETSAVGRALGFAGYGVIKGIASADEIVKATQNNGTENQVPSEPTSKYEGQKTHFCAIHQRDLKYRQEDNGSYWDHRLQIDGVWNKCYGNGKWIPQKPVVEPIPERDINES